MDTLKLSPEVFSIPKTYLPYSPEFHRQMLVDLGVLRGVVLADGGVLLTRGQRRRRLFSWMVMLGFGLLATRVVTAAVLAPALH